jgi:Domain of unknown function (DUF4266)
MNNRIFFTMALGAGFALLVGCTPVKPWQRGRLAGYTMRADRDPLGVAQDEHIFFSREGASGGRGVGGGGCGCN